MFLNNNKTQVWRPDAANFGSSKDIVQIMMISDQAYLCPFGFMFDPNYNQSYDIKMWPKLKSNKTEYMERYVNRLFDGELMNEAYVTMGGDFAFTDAATFYEMWD